MPKRILLADDSITIQKVVELTFSDGDYVVTAVNNGAKAIQKLTEMRPDVILSDIIMPEKNGYEVCEYVKSHPEFRTIPVILLTGTFEPFDPDRADKAGCDAVVTKPFESQSLIHKVEELIQASRSTATTAPQPAVGSEQLTTGIFTPNVPPAEAHEHESDIFGATPPAAEGETRAFSSMSFDELQQLSGQPAPAPSPITAPESSPWDEAPAAAPEAMTGGETRAFPTMNFDELQRMAGESAAAPAPVAAPEPEPEPIPQFEPSPWDEQPAAAPEALTGGETRAFPMMNFDELQRIPRETPEPSPEPPAAAEPSPWDDAPAGGGETRAFPSMSFDDLQKMASESAPMPFDTTPPPPAAPAPTEAASPWDEPAEEFGGETRAFSRMSFDELQKLAEPPAPEPQTEAEPEPLLAPEPVAEPEPEPVVASDAGFMINSEAAPPAGDLTDAQIDRIARRVVELMSDQVIRSIAWEVIPDMAEMVVKERIRQIEAEG